VAMGRIIEKESPKNPRYTVIDLVKACEEWAYFLELGIGACPDCLLNPNKATTISGDGKRAIMTGIYPEELQYLTENEAIELKKTAQWISL
jgi:hypothetical protein